MISVKPKIAFNKFKPESCVFVISAEKDGRPSGMIAGWNTKCSSRPPMFAVALWKKGYTHKLVRESKEFVIAVPNQSLMKAVEYFGSHHGDKVDKFKQTKIATIKANKVRPPLIKNATINLECKLVREVDSGDHIIFIGNVVAAHINESKKVLLNMKKVNGKRVFKEF